MTGGPNRFYNAIADRGTLKASDLIGYFAYYLTMEGDKAVATTAAIENCFRECDLSVPGSVSGHLAKNIKGAGAKFVKADSGYRLQRGYREQIAATLGATATVLQTSAELRKLEFRVLSGAEKGFLKEVIDCYEAGANRATIIMCWILVLDHLYEFVRVHKLAALNIVLAKNTDKRVRVSQVVSPDDFGDIPEGKFIEFLRSAGIISNDVRKILDEKLGIRNSCAHASGIAIKPSKVVEFVDDLIENVVLKYPI